MQSARQECMGRRSPARAQPPAAAAGSVRPAALVAISTLAALEAGATNATAEGGADAANEPVKRKRCLPGPGRCRSGH